MSLIQEFKLDPLKIPLEVIKSATNNFSDGNIIGQGGFGNVYKGRLPLSGDRSTTVAVKRLDIKHGQGQHEFLTEILMLSSYKHDNLVSLIGFSDKGVEKILVYEHVVHGSLDKYLASTYLTWVQRLEICLGASRALDYLHTGISDGHRVLHCDIKSSNILLDENWKPKVSDFGLSKIGPMGQEFTFLVTKVCGTDGYLDPQYKKTGVLTKESDVYSFGVVLFEVLCGRLAMNGEYHDGRRFLSQLAMLSYKEEKLDEITLPNLLEQMNPDSMRTFSSIAYQCLSGERKERPTMGIIMEELQIALDFQIGFEGIRRIRLRGSSTGGSPWSFQLKSDHMLRKIRIDHEDWIYFISFTTEDSGGLLHSSQEYGGYGGRSGGEISEITFEADEELIRILGTVGVTTGYYAGYIIITSLSFVTNKKRHGPFGKETGTPFSVECETSFVVGFYGRAGFYLDGFGCYLKKTV